MQIVTNVQKITNRVSKAYKLMYEHAKKTVAVPIDITELSNINPISLSAWNSNPIRQLAWMLYPVSDIARSTATNNISPWVGSIEVGSSLFPYVAAEGNIKKMR